MSKGRKRTRNKNRSRRQRRRILQCTEEQRWADAVALGESLELRCTGVPSGKGWEMCSEPTAVAIAERSKGSGVNERFQRWRLVSLPCRRHVTIALQGLLAGGRHADCCSLAELVESVGAGPLVEANGYILTVAQHAANRGHRIDGHVEIIGTGSA